MQGKLFQFETDWQTFENINKELREREKFYFLTFGREVIPLGTLGKI